MKLLLVDKDGTLVVTKSGERFVQTPWDQQPIDGVSDLLASAKIAGWAIAIVSNQGGVGAGHKTLEETILEMRFCLELFPQISEAFFCPDYQGQDCYRCWGSCGRDKRILYGNGWTDSGIKLAPFRKPEPGMLQLALYIHTPSVAKYVGDRPEYAAAAAAIGLPFLSAEKWLRDIPF